MTDHPATTLDLAEAVAAKDAQGKRISLSFIKNQIAETHFMVPGRRLFDGPNAANALPTNHPLNRMTLCFVTTRSGFTVVGKSAAMDPANFDKDKGATFAYEDALRQLWPLFAFAELEKAHG